jgi:CDP-diacylglycerol--glycerol-3-phosphate 3-phosphatidyltransferase
MNSKNLIKKLPNIITTIRLILSFVFIYLFIQGTRNFEALLVFAIASVSDAVDGWLARKLNITSKFGENFDPLADKVLTVCAFVAFAILGIVEFWCVIIIIFRDVFTTVLRYYFFTENKIPTSKSAKLKTAVQFIFIISILLLQALSDYDASNMLNNILQSDIIYYVMLGITVLTVWTMFEYIFLLLKSKNKK